MSYGHFVALVIFDPQLVYRVVYHILSGLFIWQLTIWITHQPPASIFIIYMHEQNND